MHPALVNILRTRTQHPHSRFFHVRIVYSDAMYLAESDWHQCVGLTARQKKRNTFRPRGGECRRIASV